MLNVFVAPNHPSGRVRVLQQIKNNLDDGNHSLIVPDRFALFHEKAVFEALEQESLFNVEVLSFSRLTKKILGTGEAVNKISGTIIIKKLLNEHSGSFRCFKTLFNAGFASEIYATIQQFKSCDILPEEVFKASGGKDYLSKKMGDLALIYKCYNEYLLDNKLYDSGDEFNRLLAGDLDNGYFLGRHIYICAFDSFTKQTYRIIEKLTGICKSVNIVVYMDENNKSLYPADTYKNIMDMTKIEGGAKIADAPNVLSGQFLHMSENLFKFKPETQKVADSQIFLSKHRDTESEILNIARIIKKGVIKENLRYKDFSLAFGNLEANALIVSKVFDEFGINYFLDTSEPLTDTLLFRFLSKCIDTVRFGFVGSDLVSLVKNPLGGFDFDDTCDFEDILTKYNFERQMFKKEIITPEREYPAFERIRKNILKNLSPLNKKSGSAFEFAQTIREVMKNFGVSGQLVKLSDEYSDEGLLKFRQQIGQVLPKFNEVLDSMTKVLGDAEIGIDEFADILKSGCESCKISGVPISLDSVFVGDTGNSFFENTHTLFIAGASAGVLPRTHQDCGIILDHEIDVLRDKYNIEPSIKTVNLRERFKLYNLCLSPQKRLFVSFCAEGTNIKESFSAFVGQIRNMFLCESGGEDKPLKIESSMGLSFVEELANVPSSAAYMSKILRKIYDGGNVVNQRGAATLLSFLKDKNTYFKDYKQLLEFRNFHKLSVPILCDTDKISASGVELFYSCPFLHFIRYGLRLDEKLACRFDSMTVGNILHSFAERLHKEIELPADDKEVRKVSTRVIDEILKEYDILLKFPENKVPSEGLRKEAERLGLALNFQAKNSDFKTLYTEAGFGVGGVLEGIKIKVGGKTLVVSGRIDRIDLLGEFFRVIDYKTGSVATGLSELYFGKKIQLYLYQAVFNKKYKPAGGYFLPIKNKPAVGGKSQDWSYRLKGYTLCDPAVILSSDRSLKEGGSSEIVEVRRTADKNGEPSFHASHSKLLTHEELLAFAEYALKLVESAARSMLGGNITPSPLVLKGSPCDYCVFGGICRIDPEFANIKREPKQKIDEEFICEAVGGGEADE